MRRSEHGDIATAMPAMAFPSWHVIVNLEVRYAGPAIDLVKHLRERLSDRLVGRLVTTPRPGFYGLVLSVIAESKETAQVRAATMVKFVINEIRGAGVIAWRVEAVPTR